MKKFLSLALASLLTGSSALPLGAQQQDPAAAPQQQTPAPAHLANKDVVEMLNAGLSAEVVVAKIKSSPTNFDTSPAALQELKSAGVPDPVILAMVQSPAGAGFTASAAVAEGVEVKVPDGTEVELQLQNTISGQELKVGDIVDLTVVRPVVLNGVTIFEKGAPGRARITTAKKAGHWGKAGKLEWAMQDVQAADGSRVPARFTQRAVGDSKGGTVATAAVITGIVFFPAAPLWGFKKGKPAVVPAGNRYSVFVQGDTAVKGKVAAAQQQPAQ